MQSTKPTWDKIEKGSRIPELIKYPDQKQIFMFSAITWNRHEIHYNHKFALQEGHKEVVVQRALLGNYLAQMVSNWIGEQGELVFLEWKVLKSANPGDKLTCSGQVDNKKNRDNQSLLECTLAITNQNAATIVSGNSKIVLSSQSDRT